MSAMRSRHGENHHPTYHVEKCGSGLCCRVQWKYIRVNKFIGASLSEPHTSETAFVEVVCMYRRLVCLQPYTVNFK